MTAETAITFLHTAASWQALVARCRDILHIPSIWRDRARHRAVLAQLDTRQMRDCGIDPAAVQAESAKPFWRA
ncbi:MAG: DUF1127 domain-containing protein [Rhodospirillales bacterium]